MLRKRVLIIADDDHFRQSLADVLKAAGYEVLEAAYARSWITFAEQLKTGIDLLIVDLRLPEVNGLEFVGAVTRREANIKIIAASGIDDDLYLKMAERLGAHKIIRKQPVGESLPVDSWLTTVQELIGSAENRTRATLEEVWRLRLEQAAKRKDSAKTNFQKALDELSAGLTIQPDGSQAVIQARQKESAARVEYMRILRIFTDLIVQGKIPPEE